MSFKLDFTSSTLNGNMTNMRQKLGSVVMMYAVTKAAEIEGTMKSNRPWVDRTGMAKATLNAKVSLQGPSKVRITLAHGVSYGIWLELAHGKNNAIIAPTIDTEGPRLLSGMGNIMGKLKL